MKFGRQILVAPQPKAVDALHVIDKSLSSLAKEINIVKRAKMAAPEKWRMLKYKLGNYLGLMAQVRKPYMQEDEDDDASYEDETGHHIESVEPVTPAGSAVKPKAKVKREPKSERVLRKHKVKRLQAGRVGRHAREESVIHFASPNKTVYPYRLRRRRWEPLYKE